MTKRDTFLSLSLILILSFVDLCLYCCSTERLDFFTKSDTILSVLIFYIHFFIMLFLDKSGKYYYLVFAFFANREKVYLGKTDQISIDKLNQLVQKQYDFFVNQKLFKDFDDQIQHPHLLHNILKKNLMISILLYTKYLPENVILDQDILKLYNKYTSYYDQDFVLDFVYNSNKIE
jgi:hypothetical protein